MSVFGNMFSTDNKSFSLSSIEFFNILFDKNTTFDYNSYIKSNYYNYCSNIPFISSQEEKLNFTNRMTNKLIGIGFSYSYWLSLFNGSHINEWGSLFTNEQSYDMMNYIFNTELIKNSDVGIKYNRSGGEMLEENMDKPIELLNKSVINRTGNMDNFKEVSINTIKNFNIDNVFCCPITGTYFMLPDEKDNTTLITRVKNLTYKNGSKNISVFGSKITFTPEAICKKLVDNISVDDFKKAENVLNICSGSGIISITLIDKMIAGGLSPEEVISRLYLVDDNQKIMDFAINVIKTKYVYAPRYKVVDALSWDFDDMKFDYIIGNPPYNKSGIVNRNHGYYYDYSSNGHQAFQLKAADNLSHDGKFIYIIPTNFLSGDMSNKFRKEILKKGNYDKLCIFDENSFDGTQLAGKNIITSFVNNYTGKTIIDNIINNSVFSSSMSLGEFDIKDHIIIPQLLGDIGKSILLKMLDKSKINNIAKSCPLIIAQRTSGAKDKEDAYHCEPDEKYNVNTLGWLNDNNVPEKMWTYKKAYYDNKKLVTKHENRDSSLTKKDCIPTYYAENCNIMVNLIFFDVPSEPIANKLSEIINYNVVALFLSQIRDNIKLSNTNIGFLPLPENIMDVENEEWYNNWLCFSVEEIEYINKFKSTLFVDFK